MDFDYLPSPGTPLEELDTPCLIVDLDTAEKNILKMELAANSMGVSMRPHAKTHKSSYWAKKQIEAGAIGICCAKVGEAEVMARAGIGEILIPNQIIGKKKTYCTSKFGESPGPSSVFVRTIFFDVLWIDMSLSVCVKI